MDLLKIPLWESSTCAWTSTILRTSAFYAVSRLHLAGLQSWSCSHEVCAGLNNSRKQQTSTCLQCSSSSWLFELITPFVSFCVWKQGVYIPFSWRKRMTSSSTSGFAPVPHSWDTLRWGRWLTNLALRLHLRVGAVFDLICLDTFSGIWRKFAGCQDVD